MFGHPKYVWTTPFIWMHPLYVWMPPYVWITPVCLDAPHVWTPSCMFGCPHMFGHPQNVSTSPFIWMDASPVCLDAPFMFGHPPVHLDTIICLNTPNMFGHPPFIWMYPLYVWMPPYVWITPVCLDARHVWTPSCMFGCSHMFGYPPVYLGTLCLDAL